MFTCVTYGTCISELFVVELGNVLFCTKLIMYRYGKSCISSLKSNRLFMPGQLKMSCISSYSDTVIFFIYIYIFFFFHTLVFIILYTKFSGSFVHDKEYTFNCKL